MNFAIVGGINSGKSTFTEKLAQKLIERKFRVSGFITPPYLVDGRKLGHNFVEISNTGFSKPIPFTRTHDFENSFQWKRYFFNQEAFEQAKKINNHCDYYIADEVGPLELDDRAGFVETITSATRASRNVIVVARWILQERLKEILDGEIKFFEPSGKDESEDFFINDILRIRER